MMIEELIEFDQQNLTFWKIILSKHRKIWNVLNFSAICLASIMIVFPVMLLPDFKWFVMEIPSAIILIVSIRFSKRKSYEILKKYYNKKYNLKLGKKWNYMTINKIRYFKIAEFNNSQKIKFHKNDIPFIIQSLKEYNSTNSYKYYSYGIIIPLVSGAIGAIVGVIFKSAKNIHELLEIVKLIFIVLIAFIVMVIYLEIFIIKSYILWKKNKYQRLIQALQDYYLNFDEIKIDS